MSEHFDDAPYDNGDISEQQGRGRGGDSALVGNLGRSRLLGRYFNDEPEQTSATLNEWQTTNPRFWE